MDNFKLLSVTEKDADLLYKLIKDMAEYEHELNEVRTSAERIKETICNQKYAKGYIGYYNDIPVSYIIYFYNYSTYLGKKGIYIEDLYINPKYRKKGIGKKIIKLILNISKNENIERIDWTCLNWNKNAIDFYKHIGAKLQEERLYFRMAGNSEI